MRTKDFFTVAALCLLAASTCFGQGELVSDKAAFDAATAGTNCLEENFDEVVFNDEGTTVQELFDPTNIDFVFGFNELTIAGGSITFEDPSGQPVSSLVANSNNLFFAVDGQATSLIGLIAESTVDDTPSSSTIQVDTSLGQVAGVCFQFQGLIADESLALLEIFDGDTLIDSFVVPFIDFPGTLGYVNTSGANITSVRFSVEGEDLVAVSDLDICFQEVAEEDTCQSLLADTVSGLQALLPTGDAYDDVAIESALANLTVMQDPVFFDDENRLSSYGLTFFLGAKYSTLFLKQVDSVDVSDSLTAIQDILACVVDAEIQAAIDRGGDQDFIDFAMYLEGCAQYFENEGNLIEATAFRKLAWLYARVS